MTELTFAQTKSPDDGQVCLCSKHHQPQPLVLNRHHIKPQEFGGATQADNLVWLCPSTHGSAHEILRLLQKTAWGGTYGMGDYERPLTYYEVNEQYVVPLSMYAYAVAWEGYRRFAGFQWRPIPVPTWATRVKVGGSVAIEGQLTIL